MSDPNQPQLDELMGSHGRRRRRPKKSDAPAERSDMDDLFASGEHTPRERMPDQGPSKPLRRPAAQQQPTKPAQAPKASEKASPAEKPPAPKAAAKVQKAKAPTEKSSASKAAAKAQKVEKVPAPPTAQAAVDDASTGADSTTDTTPPKAADQAMQAEAPSSPPVTAAPSAKDAPAPTPVEGAPDAGPPAGPSDAEVDDLEEAVNPRGGRMEAPAARQAPLPGSTLDEALSSSGGRLRREEELPPAPGEADDPFEAGAEDDDDAPAAKKSGGVSTVEGAGHPIASSDGRGGAGSKAGSGDFVPQKSLNARTAVEEGVSPPKPGGQPGSFSPSDDADDRIPLEEAPATDVGLSTLESVSKVGDAESRVSVRPGEVPVPEGGGGAFAPLQSRDERVPMRPAPKASADASTAESYGSPTTDTGERVSLKPELPASDGPSPVEGAAATTAKSDDRMSMQPAPPPAGDGSSVESYGNPVANADERVSMKPEAAPAEDGSPIEGVGNPSATGGDRLPVLPAPKAAADASTAECYGSPSVKTDDRVSMKPEAPSAEDGSPLEGMGQPSPSGSERLELWPMPDISGGSTTELYGSPSVDETERVALVQLPDIAALAVLEDYGRPSPESSERMGLWPMALQAPSESVVEAYGQPSRKGSERVDVIPRPDLAAGNVLESYGQPSPDAAQRVSLEPGSAADAESVLESYGQPAASAGDRVDVVAKPQLESGNSVEAAGHPSVKGTDRLVTQPGPSSDALEQANVLESYGSPSTEEADRVQVKGEGPDLAAGDTLEDYGHPSGRSEERLGRTAEEGAESGLEVYGKPAASAGDRVDVVGRTEVADAATTVEGAGQPSRKWEDRTSTTVEPSSDALEQGNVLESYGTPGADAAQRVELVPTPDLDGGNTLEGVGHPSRKWEDRASTTAEPSSDALQQANVLESYGSPRGNPADRMDVVEKPDLDAGKSVEAVGHPSRKWEDRTPVSPAPSSDLLEQGRVLEVYGDPVADPADRVDVRPKPDLESGKTLEGFRDPSKMREERVDLDPTPDVDPGSSTLGLIGEPSKDRAERVDLEPVADVDPDSSTMTSLVATSADRTDRMGRQEDADVESSTLNAAARTTADPTDRFGRVEDVDDDALAASALRLFKEREDRIGYVDPKAQLESPIPSPASRSILEAGRMLLREDPDKEFRPTVPTGLEGLMPDRALSGHQRMRLTDEDETEIPPELVGKVPVPPRVAQVVGTLRDDERLGANGQERVLLKEHVHRRMDFLYQRYEELHVRRGYYHCPLHPEEPVYKCREPMFVAGSVPIGNGLLAQILASVYDDHSSVFDQAGLLDRIGFTLEEESIEKALNRATTAMEPVMEALRAEVASGSGRPSVDKKGVDSERPGRRRRMMTGHMLFVGRARAAVLVHVDKGHTDELLKAVPPSRRKGELVRDLFRERIGFNRPGIWAGVRRRFTTALATNPQEAAYALFLIHAISTAASPVRGHHDELVRRSRALRAWLDDQRDLFDDPDTALQRAVVYALSCWDRMRLVDDEGDGKPVAAPVARKFPKTYTPVWEFKNDAEVQRAVTWYSLVHSCRLLGVRPWEYFFAAFSAMARDQFTDPARWTPSAWARDAGV